jgi:selenocysteine lyase/cysteine desulfurase
VRRPASCTSLPCDVDLDNAASTPALPSVLDTVNRFLEQYSSLHDGAGFQSCVSTCLYEQARETVLELVGADCERDIVYSFAMQEDLNLVAERWVAEWPKRRCE